MIIIVFITLLHDHQSSLIRANLNTAQIQIVWKVIFLKEWECVQVSHQRDVGKTIEEWQKKGWLLHTYQATGTPTAVNLICRSKKANKANRSSKLRHATKKRRGILAGGLYVEG
jgi:hypothetical protein